MAFRITIWWAWPIGSERQPYKNDISSSGTIQRVSELAKLFRPNPTAPFSIVDSIQLSASLSSIAS